MSIKFADVVFLQGDEGREVTDLLFDVEGVVAHGTTAESIAAAFEYLQQWDYGDDELSGELFDEPPAGSGDLVVWSDDGQYVLTASLGLGYAGLVRVVKS